MFSKGLQEHTQILTYIMVKKSYQILVLCHMFSGDLTMPRLYPNLQTVLFHTTPGLNPTSVLFKPLQSEDTKQSIQILLFQSLQL